MLNLMAYWMFYSICCRLAVWQSTGSSWQLWLDCGVPCGQFQAPGCVAAAIKCWLQCKCLVRILLLSFALHTVLHLVKGFTMQLPRAYFNLFYSITTAYLFPIYLLNYCHFLLFIYSITAAYLFSIYLLDYHRILISYLCTQLLPRTYVLFIYSITAMYLFPIYLSPIACNSIPKSLGLSAREWAVECLEKNDRRT